MFWTVAITIGCFGQISEGCFGLTVMIGVFVSDVLDFAISIILGYPS